MLLERFEALAQGEHALDIFLHDEILCRLLELHLPHPAVVRLSPIALAAEVLPRASGVLTISPKNRNSPPSASATATAMAFLVHIKTDVFAKLFHDVPPQWRLPRLGLNNPQA